MKCCLGVKRLYQSLDSETDWRGKTYKSHIRWTKQPSLRCAGKHGQWSITEYEWLEIKWWDNKAKESRRVTKSWSPLIILYIYFGKISTNAGLLWSLGLSKHWLTQWGWDRTEGNVRWEPLGSSKYFQEWRRRESRGDRKRETVCSRVCVRVLVDVCLCPCMCWGVPGQTCHHAEHGEASAPCEAVS